MDFAESPPQESSNRTRRIVLSAVVVLLAIGIARIAATYHVFVQVVDEPAHVATGMEWLDRHAYTYEALHPPLARISVALGPYLAGVRSTNERYMWDEGNALLYAGGRYWRNLTLARIGVLPFFLLAGIVVFTWARRLGGASAGVAALLLFTTLPPILAHAGLATTDLPVTATFALALFTLAEWLDRPTLARGIAAGAGIGLALVTKFSVVLFLPAAALAMALVRGALARSRGIAAGGVRGEPRSRLAWIAAGALTAMLVIWATYRFSFGPVLPVPNRGLAPATGLLAAPPTGPNPAYIGLRALFAPVFPAPEWFRGLGKVILVNHVGRKAYLLGEAYVGGKWLFFPVALGVKTPLAFLVFALTGLGTCVACAYRTGKWRYAAPAAAALAILAVAVPSNINLGLRHILPIYPPLAVAAGVAASDWMRRGGRLRWCAGVLIAWQSVDSARAHPDYLAYFNELARSRPERVLVDSDLDWGQDLDRLARTLRERRLAHVSIAYHGTADLWRHGLPPFERLRPEAPRSGWVAASIFSVKLGADKDTSAVGFRWLDRFEPRERIGRSIFLYFIPESALAHDGSGTASLPSPGNQ